MTDEEQKLKIALEYAREKELEQYIVEAEALSKTQKNMTYYRTRKKMLSAMSDHRQADSPVSSKRSLKSARKTIRTALLVAALILLFAVSAFAVQQVYEFYHVVDNPTDSDVFLTPDPNSKSDLFGKYTYIPDGFQKTETYRSLWYREEEITYENADGDLLVCRSGMITPGGIHGFNTEKGKLIDIRINCQSGKALTGQYDDSFISSIIWVSGNTYHTIDGDNLPIKELIKVAENRK